MGQGAGEREWGEGEGEGGEGSEQRREGEGRRRDPEIKFLHVPGYCDLSRNLVKFFRSYYLLNFIY